MDGYQFGALLEGALRRYLGPHDLEVRRGGEGQYEFWFYDVVANGRGIIQAIGTQHMDTIGRPPQEVAEGLALQMASYLRGKPRKGKRKKE